VDSGLQAGSVIGTDYDPMLAKVIAWGPDRPTCLARLRGALAATSVLGLTTNVGFLRRLVDRPEVRAAQLDTELVDRIAADLVAEPDRSEVVGAAALLARLLEAPPGPIVDPWDRPDSWRVTGPAVYSSRWRLAGQVFAATLDDNDVGVEEVPRHDHSAASAPTQSGARPALAWLDQGDGKLVVERQGGLRRYGWAADGDLVWLGRDGDTWSLIRLRETIDRPAGALGGNGPLTSPMPGTVLAVHVHPGQAVSAGQPLVTVEAMKMEHAVAAAADGVVQDVLVRPGESVRLDQPLVVVTAPTADADDHAARD
jgi:acetyl-CoA/propionyl-CoA carboxylase, biotin carboxylase, biotin carboxyl carrier protein